MKERLWHNKIYPAGYLKIISNHFLEETPIIQKTTIRTPNSMLLEIVKEHTFLFQYCYWLWFWLGMKIRHILNIITIGYVLAKRKATWQLHLYLWRCIIFLWFKHRSPFLCQVHTGYRLWGYPFIVHGGILPTLWMKLLKGKHHGAIFTTSRLKKLLVLN